MSLTVSGLLVGQWSEHLVFIAIVFATSTLGFDVKHIEAANFT